MTDSSDDLIAFFADFSFTRPIDLPAEYEVYDFSRSYDPQRERFSEFGVGKYDEKRPGMYQGELYRDQRDIHVGIDISAPVGTEIKAFYPGEVICCGNNKLPWDYGYTLITGHKLSAKKLYVLWGHLSRQSLEGKLPGRTFRQGEVIAWIGDRYDNGGWNPHLHFQLSWLKPEVADLPGVVNEKDRRQALLDFPDPRLVWGPLY